MKTADVCWAGPHLRAEAKLREAGELLSRRKFSQGMDLLAEVQRELAAEVEFVMQEASE